MSKLYEEEKKKGDEQVSRRLENDSILLGMLSIQISMLFAKEFAIPDAILKNVV